MLIIGQKVLVKSQPVDYKQYCREGIILGKVALEPSYYRVKLNSNNMILIVNDSMLEAI